MRIFRIAGSFFFFQLVQECSCNFCLIKIDRLLDEKVKFRSSRNSDVVRFLRNLPGNILKHDLRKSFRSASERVFCGSLLSDDRAGGIGNDFRCLETLCHSLTESQSVHEEFCQIFVAYDLSRNPCRHIADCRKILCSGSIGFFQCNETRGCVYVGYGVGIDDIRAAQRPSP